MAVRHDLNMEDQPQLNDSPETAPEESFIAAPKKSRFRRMSPGKLAIVICSLLAIVVITMAGILIAILLRNPAFQVAMKNYQVMVQCEDQLAEIGGALDRYVTGNDHYPAKLEDLCPEYL